MPDSPATDAASLIQDRIEARYTTDSDNPAPDAPSPTDESENQKNKPIRLAQFLRATIALEKEGTTNPTLFQCFTWCISEEMNVGVQNIVDQQDVKRAFDAWQRAVRRA